MLWIILVILIILTLAGGLWVSPAYGPWWGWSPLGLVLLIIVILFLLGTVRF